MIYFFFIDGIRFVHRICLFTPATFINSCAANQTLTMPVNPYDFGQMSTKRTNKNVFRLFHHAWLCYASFSYPLYLSMFYKSSCKLISRILFEFLSFI